MFCPRCGSQNGDQMKYCERCGAPLNAFDNGRAMPHAGTPVYSGNLMGALRGLISSPLYLVAVIGFTTQIVMTIIASATGYSQYAALFYRMLNESGLDYYLDYQTLSTVNNIINNTNIMSAAISNAPSIAICAGLWILFAQAHDQMKRIDTTGFTVIRIVVIIRFVLYALGLALGVILTFIGIVVLNSYVDDVWGIGLGIIVLILAFGALTILYYLKVLKMIGSAKDIIISDRKTAPAYLYVIVLTFIAAGLQCISALSALLTQGILFFLANAAGATACICFGLLMNKFNKLEMQQAPGQINVSVNIQGNAPYGGAYNRPQAPVQPSPMQQAPVQPSPMQQAPVQGRQPNYIPDYNPAMQANIKVPKPGTTVLGYDEEEKKNRYASEGTMVLSDNFNMPQAKLIRMRDQAQIPITKPSFTIGKAYGNVDYFIEDNPAISRKHAMIVLNDGKFYVMDTKSTNHVYVDGKQIPSETPVLLTDGVKLRFADEVYQFIEN